MLLGRARTLCCALLCSLVLLATVSSASWLPNESAAAGAEYQNRGPAATAYELTLGDLLPEHLLREDQSLNFVNKHFRWVFCRFTNVLVCEPGLLKVLLIRKVLQACWFCALACLPTACASFASSGKESVWYHPIRMPFSAWP